MLKSTTASVDEALAAVTDELAGAQLDPEGVLRSALAILSERRAGTWIATLMSNDPRTQLVVSANRDEPQLAKYVEERNPTGAAPTWSFSQTVIETGEPVLVPLVSYEEFVAMQVPAEAEALERDKPPTDPIACVGFVMVALRTREATLGTLALFDHKCPEPLTQSDAHWVQVMADRIAIGVENGQIRVAAKRRQERLSALRSVALAMAGGRDLRFHLQVILDQAIVGLNVNAADLLVLDEEDGLLRIVASSGFQTMSGPEYRVPLHEALPGDLLVGQPASSEFTPDEGRRRTLFAREGFRSRRAMPLISQGRTTGVIEVFSRADLDPEPEWLDFLEMLACEAFVAIDRAGTLDRFAKPPHDTATKKPSASPDFTRLEAKIMGLVVEGLSNAAIGDQVHLSQHTIKFHVHRILQMAEVANRTELARKATKEGWL
jgi:DNA-binding CsgD family transcriptional regulator